jgi:hypothetical protein
MWFSVQTGYCVLSAFSLRLVLFDFLKLRSRQRAFV